MKNWIPIISTLFFGFFLISCKQEPPATQTDRVVPWEPYDDSLEVAGNAAHEIKRMRYKLIQSKVLDKNTVFRPLYDEVSQMTEEDYLQLKPLIFEQDIPTIQSHIREGRLTYEELSLFYLYRIYRYELDNTTSLHTVIALNPHVLEEARALDANDQDKHPIYGMPILLKDNINTADMKTTAGAIALMHNSTGDAFIVEQLRQRGALILGKVNLSEWAYFLCRGCPVGYSAVGGQTLNPYGRRIFETGGSSSGSGTSVAANYAVAAVGTETSGSILSPSGQNSVVGLKPTIGTLSRSGIVPISSTLDTPGPMAKNVVDNRILFDALLGKDVVDEKSVELDWNKSWYEEEEAPSLQGKRLGAFKNLIERDSLYRETVEKLKNAGVIVVEFDPPEVGMDGFLSILNGDMKNDLPRYLSSQITDQESVSIRSIADAVDFNAMDSLVRIPYGQALFEGILTDTTSVEALEVIKSTLEQNGRHFFDSALDTYQLDAVLSINNYHAGFAAVAKYPALTIPLGYRVSGEPVNLTFIAKSFQEQQLYEIGNAFEFVFPARRPPKGYD